MKKKVNDGCLRVLRLFDSLFKSYYSNIYFELIEIIQHLQGIKFCSGYICPFKRFNSLPRVNKRDFTSTKFPNELCALESFGKSPYQIKPSCGLPSKLLDGARAPDDLDSTSTQNFSHSLHFIFRIAYRQWVNVKGEESDLKWECLFFFVFFFTIRFCRRLSFYCFMKIKSRRGVS